jgi:hypothetical protein
MTFIEFEVSFAIREVAMDDVVRDEEAEAVRRAFGVERASQIGHQFADSWAAKFAALNGWKVGSNFTLRMLAEGSGVRGRNDSYATSSLVLDHPVYFKFERTPMCMIGMPYHHNLDDALAMAKPYGLRVLEPPLRRAGWWYPGSTYCFAFVRPGTEVRWLPEQAGVRGEPEPERVALTEELQADILAGISRRASRDGVRAVLDEAEEAEFEEAEEEAERESVADELREANRREVGDLRFERMARRRRGITGHRSVGPDTGDRELAEAIADHYVANCLRVKRKIVLQIAHDVRKRSDEGPCPLPYDYSRKNVVGIRTSDPEYAVAWAVGAMLMGYAVFYMPSPGWGFGKGTLAEYRERLRERPDELDTWRS